jgi:hypothetical protein
MKKMKKIALFLLFIMLIAKNSHAQQIIQQDGKYGVIDEKGKVIAPPIYDSAYQTKFRGSQGLDNPYIITVKNDKYGMILTPEKEDFYTIEPKFDTIIHRDYGYLILKQGNKWGFVLSCIASHSGGGFFSSNAIATQYKNIIISKIEYDDLYNEFDSRYLKKDGKYGLRYSCDNIVPAEYDTLIYEYNKQTIVGQYYLDPEKSQNSYLLAKIVKNGKFNYLAMGDKNSNKIIFPYTYEDKDISYIGEGLFIINQIGKPLLLFNVIDSTYKKLVDEQDKEIVLDKYYYFPINNDVYAGKISILKILGMIKEDSEYITIFININNGKSLIYKDIIPPWGENANKYDKVLGVHWGPSRANLLFTAFISQDVYYVEDGVRMRDFSLLTLPNKTVVYHTKYSANDEYIEVNSPKVEKIQCCCQYFQIVKYIKSNNRYNDEKKRVLGYIHYKTYKFSKKRPEGSEHDQENKVSGEMYE